MTGSTFDVVVVGGGVIGLSVAWRAARQGFSVAVCDPEPGRGASWAAAGMLAPTAEARWGEGPLHELAQASAALWPTFAGELEDEAGAKVGFRQDGALSVALGTDDYRALEDAVDVQRKLGCAAELLSGRECRRLEPSVHPRVVGGALYPGDHQVDNRAVVRALSLACRRRGAQVRATAARRLRRGAGGKAAGVDLADGSVLGAGAVVLAAGCRSGSLEGPPPEDLPPVRPVKGQILRLGAGRSASVGGRAVITRTVTATAEGRRVYLVPRANGELVVGATVEERGFDTTVTAGAVFELLRSAVAIVPDVAELELSEAIARLRPGTPDNGPVLGPAPATEGLLLATGHYRHGFLLAPVTVEALGEVLAGRPLPAPAVPFSASRFDVREPVRG
ncbi:MAG: glycine oxidase ThiO [Acidimicrobiales bacterium]